MIREERSPAFWTRIAAHPALASAVMGLEPEQIAALAQNDAVLPLAADHGGFFFARLDAFGFVRELHTLFTPEGWGREAVYAGREALDLVFSGPCAVITTYELAHNPHSRPPKRYGFVCVGEWTATPFGEARSWLLTRGVWLARRQERMH